MTATQRGKWHLPVPKTKKISDPPRVFPYTVEPEEVYGYQRLLGGQMKIRYQARPDHPIFIPGAVVALSVWGTSSVDPPRTHLFRFISGTVVPRTELTLQEDRTAHLSKLEPLIFIKVPTILPGLTSP